MMRSNSWQCSPVYWGYVGHWKSRCSCLRCDSGCIQSLLSFPFSFCPEIPNRKGTTKINKAVACLLKGISITWRRREEILALLLLTSVRLVKQHLRRYKQEQNPVDNQFPVTVPRPIPRASLKTLEEPEKRMLAVVRAWKASRPVSREPTGPVP